MNLDLGTQYYLKAVDYYPFNLEFTIENLQYALSYNEAHPQALCLLGQIYMFDLKEYRMAKECFRMSIAADIDHLDNYKFLGILYGWLGEYASAFKVISFALTRPGCSVSIMLRIKAEIQEQQGNYKEAKKTLIKAKMTTTHGQRIELIDKDLKRVKEKAKFKKKRKGKRKPGTQVYQNDSRG